jgi:hypothetical protein
MMGVTDSDSTGFRARSVNPDSLRSRIEGDQENFFIYIGFNPAQLPLVRTVFAPYGVSQYSLHAVDAKAATGAVNWTSLQVNVSSVKDVPMQWNQLVRPR